MKQNQTLGVDTSTTTPPEGSIQQVELMPESKPNAGTLKDVTVLDVPEVDLSVMQFEDYDTLPLTLGSQRPILGILPLGDLALCKEQNATEFTRAKHPVASDQEQLSISAMVKGTNIINPLSLPPVGPKDDVSEATLRTKLFGNNGPSISTRGSARRAAVEQSASTIKSVIVKAFNRSIPFTDLGEAQRTFMLAAYECELGKVQLFLQSIDSLRGYAKYLAKQGIQLDDSWLPLYDPDIYTALLAFYNGVQDLLVYDHVFHMRIEKLCRPYTASKRVAYPGAVLMQDCMIAEHGYTGPLGAQHISHPVPNLSMVEWWSVLLDPNQALTAVRQMLSAVKSIRTDYECVITALAQLVSKGALREMHLQQFLPVEPSPTGFLQFSDAEPCFSYSFHERFEYAPETIVGEVGTTQEKSVWTIHQLPNTNADARPSQCMSRRPVGKCHGSEAFKISELIDVGLFKTVPTDDPIISIANWQKDDYAALGTKVALALAVGSSDENNWSDATMFVDAVYGDAYVDGRILRATFFGSTIELHGLSLYATGSGLHNVLSCPAIYTAQTSNSGIPGAYIDVGGGVGFFNNVNIQGLAAAHEMADMMGALQVVGYLMESFDLSIFYVPCPNPSGVRQVPFFMERGYGMSGFYEFGLTPVDNAVGKQYLELVPEMVIDFQKKR